MADVPRLQAGRQTRAWARRCSPGPGLCPLVGLREGLENKERTNEKERRARRGVEGEERVISLKFTKVTGDAEMVSVGRTAP